MLTIQDRIRYINKRIVTLEQYIAASENYIAQNRYDRDAVVDAQSDITRYNSELLSLCSERTRLINALNNAARAKRDIRAANATKELQELRHSYTQLESRADQLEELIFNCDVNMDKRCRNAELAEQAKCELAVYLEERANISSQMEKMLAEIKKRESQITPNGR